MSWITDGGCQNVSRKVAATDSVEAGFMYMLVSKNTFQ